MWIGWPNSIGRSLDVGIYAHRASCRALPYFAVYMRDPEGNIIELEGS